MFSQDDNDKKAHLNLPNDLSETEDDILKNLSSILTNSRPSAVTAVLA